MLADFLGLVGLAYLFGSIPFGKLLGKHYGVDIQKHGSGNIGFANVRRTLGWGPGLVVLAGDVLKGLIPVLIAKHYVSTNQSMAVAAAALVGHIFPVWLKFKGGKGIATGLGISLGLNYLIGLGGVVVYAIALAFFRKSGPSSVAATYAMPLIALLIAPKYAWFYVGLAVIATWTHRTNLKDLRKPTYAG